MANACKRYPLQSFRALIGVVSLTSANCGNQAARPDDDTVVSIEAGFEVEVRAAGVEPRRAMRFHAGAVDKVVDLALQWRAAAAAEPEPQHVLQLSWKGNGGFRREIAVLDARPGLPVRANPAERAAIAEIVSRLRSIRGYAIGDAIGIRSVVQRTGQPMQPDLPFLIYVLSTPLPDAAVGVGASWRGVTRFPLHAANVTITFDYQLESWEGSVASVNVSGQAISIPAEENSDRLVIQVTGRLLVSPSDYLPRSASVQLQYPGQPDPTVGGTSLRVTLEPAEGTGPLDRTTPR